ncbi:hypothetical protein JHU04_002475 [Brenneria sp. 4F2]|nr:hypothetical protein [Brenneria bubanii]
MENASYRKKARRIESQLLGKLAVFGQAKFAKMIGVHESTVSRMKDGWFSQVSLALAILEYGVDDTELAYLAKEVAKMLINKKSPAATEDSKQFSMDF